MKRLAIAAVLFAAVVAASVAYSATSPSAKLAKQDRLWGGGYTVPGCSINDPTFCPGNTRNFAVDAHAEGSGADAVGSSAQNLQTSRSVTCLRVDGNKAVIGGILLETTNGNPGDYYLQYVIDRGTSAPTAQRDLLSALYTGPSIDPWPAGFPYTCPPPLDADGVYPAFLVLAGGDLNVQDAPSS